MAIVKLKIRKAPDNEFIVILTANNSSVEIDGVLPTLPPELTSFYEDWQSAYRQIDDVRSCITELRLTAKKVTNYSPKEYTVAVKEHLNQWLNSGDSRWRPIRDRLIAIAKELHSSNEEIHFIIDAKDQDLYRLPWQEWSLFQDHYPQAEIALRVPKNLNQQPDKVFSKNSNFRILVAVGRSNGINTHKDLNIIQELAKSGVEIVPLLQPSPKDLQEALWDEQGYDIFIFTGHSGSREDGQIGWIELNEQDTLSIEDFKKALKKAINRGLQLGIFNSCDGLGLANQLAELQLPQIIVMREPVPDVVAVEFLRYFFQELTRNSLYTSVHEARNRLEHFESQYPGAMWLPTICIEPNTKPFTLQPPPPEVTPKLVTREEPKSVPVEKPKNIKLLLLIGLVSTLISSGVYLVGKKLLSQDFSSVTAPAGTWLYGGSTSWAPIRKYIEPKIKQVHPQFELRYTDAINGTPGSGTGIRMLLDGQLNFSQSSRPIANREYQEAQARGFTLKQIPVVLDGLAIAVHPELQITGLTIGQIKDIYTGKITNWNQVGGPDLKITAYSRRFEDGGTVEFFVDTVLSGQNLGSNIVYVYSTTDALKKLATDPSGIYYASAPEIIPQCKLKPLPIARQGNSFVAPYKEPLIPNEKCPNQRNQLNLDVFRTGEYPITRQMFVIVKQDNNSLEQQAGEAYAKMLLTPQGQDLMNQAGFVRVR